MNFASLFDRKHSCFVVSLLVEWMQWMNKIDLNEKTNKYPKRISLFLLLIYLSISDLLIGEYCFMTCFPSGRTFVLFFCLL